MERGAFIIFLIVYLVGIFSNNSYILAFSFALLSLLSFLAMLEGRNLPSLRLLGFFIFIQSTIDFTRRLLMITRHEQAIVFPFYIELASNLALIFSIAAFVWFMRQKRGL